MISASYKKGYDSLIILLSVFSILLVVLIFRISFILTAIPIVLLMS
jgi:hypothetical protein